MLNAPLSSVYKFPSRLTFLSPSIFFNQHFPSRLVLVVRRFSRFLHVLKKSFAREEPATILGKILCANSIWSRRRNDSISSIYISRFLNSYLLTYLLPLGEHEPSPLLSLHLTSRATSVSFLRIWSWVAEEFLSCRAIRSRLLHSIPLIRNCSIVRRLND